MNIGDKVLCIDDTDGAHFLVAGQVYEVVGIQDGRLVLDGMARAWEAARFAAK